MFKILDSSYNRKKRSGYFLLNLKKNSLCFLLKNLNLNNVIAIIEKTDGKVDYSSDLEKINHNRPSPLIFRIQSSNYQLIEELISKDEDADILLIELSFNNSKELLLNNIDNIDRIIVRFNISNCIININKFESEITILLNDINDEQFKKIKEIIKKYKQN